MSLSRRALMANAIAMTALAAGCGTTTSVAETNNDVLGDLDATGVAARIRAREITPAEALDAAIARTARVNPRLNFLAQEAYEYGRAHAAAAPAGPFAGVPTLIKDLSDVAGLPTRNGSRAFVNNVAQSQSPYIDALTAGGLVIFGKSTTPEFGLTATTEPMLGGPTRNPWNTAFSCGGSSGGAAAAVASRAIPIAHASDGGGSIRIPASCNGLVGLKPSRGRHIANSRASAGLELSVWGAVTRTVRDTAAWHALTERTGADAAFPPVGLVTGPNTRRLRIVVDIADLRGDEPHAEVRAAIEAAAALCRGLGHEVRMARAGSFDGPQLADDFILLWAAGAAQVVARVRQAAPQAQLDQLLEPLTLDLARHYASAPAGAMDAALVRLRAVSAQYARIFANADVVLTPVLSKPPLPIGEIAPELGMEVGFARAGNYAVYTPLQNVAGTPAISLPLGWSSNGLPIGAHFCAAAGQERTLLELAYELEQAQPWAGRLPGVNAG
jgi:amidase